MMTRSTRREPGIPTLGLPLCLTVCLAAAGIGGMPCAQALAAAGPGQAAVKSPHRAEQRPVSAPAAADGMRGLTPFLFDGRMDYLFGRAFGIAIGDFNRDGYDDIAEVTKDTEQVLVAFSRGDGTFGEGRLFGAACSGSAEPYENAITSGDFNGDGSLDLAYSHRSPYSVAVLLGNGTGWFHPVADEYSLGTTADSAVTADFDLDGRLDMAFSHFGGLNVYLGQGDGTFAPLPSLVGDYWFVRVADINEDALPDLLCLSPADDAVHVFLGFGDGSFAESTVAVEPITYNSTLDTGDFNQDGHVDFVWLDHTHGGRLFVYLGLGDGTFVAGPECELPTNFGWRSQTIVQDVNRDGVADIIAGIIHGLGPQNGLLAVFFGNGDGSFQPRVETSCGEGSALRFAAGHFNGDGSPDLAVQSGDRLTVLVNRGDGSFQDAAHYVQDASSAFADFNEDGHLDWVGVAAGYLIVRLGTGDVRFAPPFTLDTAAYKGLATGDFDRDGHADVVSLRHDWLLSVSVSLGRGDGSFKQPSVTTLPEENDGTVAVTGDVDRDGNLDVVVGTDWFRAERSLVAWVLLGTGDGFFAVPTSVDCRFTGGVLADFDHDGNADLLCEEGSTLRFGAGDGSFPTAVTTGVEGDSNAVAAGDFDADGNLDIVTLTQLAFGDGAGGFSAPLVHTPDPPYTSASLIARDFNRDGYLDLLVAARTWGLAVLQLGWGDGTFSAAGYYGAWANADSVVTADFDADGYDDFVLHVAPPGVGGAFVFRNLGAEFCRRHGDVDGNGALTAADAQLAFGFALGVVEPTAEQRCAADCNGDNRVTAADAQGIFGAVLGTGTCLHPVPRPE